MSSKNITRVGDSIERQTIKAYNRSGATRKKGDILMADLLMTATETTSIVLGDEANVLANLVVPATAGLATFPMYVLLDDTVADNKIGEWLVSGPMAEISARDDDVATTDVDAGDGIAILNGQHDAEAWTTGNRVLGTWLEDAAASGSDGDATTKRGIWWGGIPGAGTISG